MSPNVATENNGSYNGFNMAGTHAVIMGKRKDIHLAVKGVFTTMTYIPFNR